MWATPVLEKMAYDTALVLANKMKDYTHYQKSNGSWGDFKKYTVFLNPPDGQPGWGYAVEHDPSDAYVTKEEAEDILKDFETGQISLDQMFRNFNAKLAGTDGAADLIKHATVVFKRGAVGGAWELLTMYPKGKLSASGWECQQNWQSGSLVFRKGVGGAQDTFQNNTLP
jgi:hypothetical protein